MAHRLEHGSCTPVTREGAGSSFVSYLLQDGGSSEIGLCDLPCVHPFICALWSPAGKGLTSWLSFVMNNCEFVTFRLVCWVRCGT